MFSLQHAGLSDPGRVRVTNEDRWAAVPTLGLYLVADGLGGHFAGDVAADIVARAIPIQIREHFSEVSKPLASDDTANVQALLSSLSDKLVEQTKGEFGLEGLGATVVLLLVRDGNALVAHLGDSRAYLLRNGRFTRLTKDHTLVQLLLDRSEITSEEAFEHPARHQLTRYMGMADVMAADVCLIEVQAGDRFLLCTDGLTGMVDDTQIHSILASAHAPKDTCEELIASANDAGGVDNITAVMVVCGNESVDAPSE